MTPSSTYSVLPFYDKLKYQYHRQSNSFGAYYPLIIPKDKFIPFQFTKTKKRSSNILSTGPGQYNIGIYSVLQTGVRNFTLTSGNKINNAKIATPNGLIITITSGTIIINEPERNAYLSSGTKFTISGPALGGNYMGSLVIVNLANVSSTISPDTYGVYAIADNILSFRFLAPKTSFVSAGDYQKKGTFDFTDLSSLSEQLEVGQLENFELQNNHLALSVTWDRSPNEIVELDGTTYLSLYDKGYITITAPEGYTLTSVKIFCKQFVHNIYLEDCYISIQRPTVDTANNVTFYTLTRSRETFDIKIDGVVGEPVIVSKIEVSFTNSIPDINTISVFDKNSNLVVENVVDKFTKAGLELIPDTTEYLDSVVFFGRRAVNLDLPDGQYFIVATAMDGSKFYSEVFNLVDPDSLDCYLRLDWYDYEDLKWDSGAIIYLQPNNEDTKYHNILYIPASLDRPEYAFDEEGEERDGFFFAEKQLSEKVYKFVFLAPEFLCDVVRLIAMADKITITEDGKDYYADRFTSEIAWQEQGDLASVNVEFRTGAVIKKIASKF